VSRGRPHRGGARRPAGSFSPGPRRPFFLWSGLWAVGGTGVRETLLQGLLLW
jgi:hypothetical protein